LRFAFDDDVTALRQEARRFLTNRSSSKAVRAAMVTERGYDPDLWAEVCEMGWSALVVSEEHGGAGLSWVALTGLLEETGRALFCGPLLSTLMGQAALLVGGGPGAKDRWLPALAAGEATATLAPRLPGHDDDLTAERLGDTWILRGLSRFVPDGATADLLVVQATDRLYLVPTAAEGVSVRALPTLDMTRKLAEVRFDDVRVEADAALDPNATERALDLAAAAVAAEQSGGARACLEMAVDYAKVREQFGRPIGSFQAVQHMCADMMVQAESARSAAWFAGWAAAEDPGALPTAAAAARAYCSEAYLFCAGQNIQVHGGIGFTWEHDAHLHFKRARSSMALLGDASAWRARYADHKGI
jgi:alkylation response protein AidB-like acyl-CoA dehydrogenase